jgi:hypothetical protein
VHAQPEDVIIMKRTHCEIQNRVRSPEHVVKNLYMSLLFDVGNDKIPKNIHVIETLRTQHYPEVLWWSKSKLGWHIQTALKDATHANLL